MRSKLTSVRLTQRAHIVLLAAGGLQNKEIAERLAVGRVQVSRWRDRYAESRLAGSEQDLPRGAPPVKVDVAQPKPFIWTKSARDILQKVIRANSRLSSKQNATH